MNKLSLTFMLLCTVCVVYSMKDLPNTQIDLTSTTLASDYFFFTHGENASNRIQAPGGQFCLVEDEFNLAGQDLVVESKTMTVNIKMAKASKIPNALLQSLFGGDDDDDDEHEGGQEGGQEGEGGRDDEDDGTPEFARRGPRQRFVWVDKTTNVVIGPANLDTNAANSILVPWFHWWFVVVDSSGNPKWSKNTFDIHQPWDMEVNLPMSPDGTTPLYNSASGDQVKFVSESCFGYFAQTHDYEDPANNKKPFKFLVFDVLTNKFTPVADLTNQKRFKVVPFSSLNILKSNGTPVLDSEVLAGWPNAADDNYVINTTFENYRIFRFDQHWMMLHQPKGWVYIKAAPVTGETYRELYFDQTAQLTTSDLIAVPWVQWFFKPQFSPASDGVYQDYPNFLESLFYGEEVQFWEINRPPKTMDQAGNIVDLWTFGTTDLRVIIEQDALAVLTAMSQDYQSALFPCDTGVHPGCDTKLNVPVNIFKKEHVSDVVVPGNEKWQYALIPWSSNDFTCTSCGSQGGIFYTSTTGLETLFQFTRKVVIRGQHSPKLLYVKVADRSVVFSAAGLTTDQFTVVMFNPKEIDVYENGVLVENPQERVDFRRLPWPQEFTYKLKDSVTLPTEFGCLPVNSGNGNVDFITFVLDPQIIAYPYDANLFNAALPSMTNSVGVDTIQVQVATLANIPQYVMGGDGQEGGEGGEGGDGKDGGDDDDIVLIINQTTNLVDWRATLGDPSYGWDFSTHYYFPPIFMFLSVVEQDGTSWQPQGEWNLEHPPLTTAGAAAWDFSTFGFNPLDPKDHSGVDYAALPSLKLEFGKLLYWDILLEPWMFVGRLDSSKYQTVWSLDSVYEDKKTFSWPCNIDFIIQNVLDRLVDSGVIAQEPQFGIGCEHVRELVHMLEQQGQPKVLGATEAELATKMNAAREEHNRLYCQPPQEGGEGGNPPPEGDGTNPPPEGDMTNPPPARMLQTGCDKKAFVAQLVLFKHMSQGRKMIPQIVAGCGALLDAILTGTTEEDLQLKQHLAETFQEGEDIKAWFEREKNKAGPIQDATKLQLVKDKFALLNEIPLSEPKNSFKVKKILNEIVKESPKLQGVFCQAINQLNELDLSKPQAQRVFMRIVSEFKAYVKGQIDGTAVPPPAEFAFAFPSFKDMATEHFGQSVSFSAEDFAIKSGQLFSGVTTTVKDGANLVIPATNYNNFKGQVILLKGTNSLLDAQGAPLDFSWDSYFAFRVAADVLPYEIIEDVSPYIWVTTAADTTTPVTTALSTGTDYVVHYDYTNLLNGATPTTIELWEGNFQDYPESTTIAAPGTKPVNFNPDTVKGLQIRLYGLRIVYADKVQIAITGYAINGKECFKYLDAVVIDTSSVDFNDANAVQAMMDSIKEAVATAPPLQTSCTSDSECKNSTTCTADNTCDCGTSGFKGPLCGVPAAEQTQNENANDALVDNVDKNDPDAVVVVLAYVAGTGAAKKDTVSKAITAIKSLVTGQNVNKEQVQSLLENLRAIKKVGKNSRTAEEEKALSKENNAANKELGVAIAILYKDGGSVATDVYVFSIAQAIEILEGALARRVLVDTLVQFTAESVTFIAPSQVLASSTHPNIDTYNGYFLITDMSEYEQSEGYEFVVSPVTYFDFTLKSDGSQVQFNDASNPVTLVLYSKVYDASKTYKVMTYDLATDTFTFDESIVIVSQDPETMEFSITISKAGYYAIGYKDEDVVTEEEEEEDDDEVVDNEEDDDDDGSSNGKLLIGLVGLIMLMN